MDQQRITAEYSKSLKGRLRPPSDKSISHRALIISLLTIGRSTIEHILRSDDIENTMGACRALGAGVSINGSRVTVDGAGIGTLLQPQGALDFGNSGTSARLFMGIVAGHDLCVEFNGDSSLRKRPMRRVLHPLNLMGAACDIKNDHLPLRICGTSEPLPISYKCEIPSAQVKSAILLAGLNSPGVVEVIEPRITRDHTEKMLQSVGAELEFHNNHDGGRSIKLRGRPELRASKWIIPADPSSSAFPLVAALITPNSEIMTEEVIINPLRAEFIATLQKMGADISLENKRYVGGEMVADIIAKSSELHGVDIAAKNSPSQIDEYPILAVAAAFATGESRFRGLQELRVKESDRLSAIVNGLRANGVECEIIDDDLLIFGRGSAIGGGMIETKLDHRIAMSFLVLVLASRKAITIDNAATINSSFPDFAGTMRHLGAKIS